MFRIVWLLRWAWNNGHIVEVLGGIGVINLMVAAYYTMSQPRRFAEFYQLRASYALGLGLICIGMALLFWIGQRFAQHQKYHQPEMEPEAKARITRGKYCLEHHEFAAAEHEFSMAAEFSPAAQIVHWRAITRYAMGNHKATAKDLKKAIKRYAEEGQLGHAAALQRFLNQ